MWVSQGLIGLLFMMASAEAYETVEYSSPGQSPSANEDALVPVKAIRSGIFWTGSRYNRRRSLVAANKKQVRQRGDRFFMGSRYGKRGDSEDERSRADPCKIFSLQRLYPCSIER